MIRRRDKYYIIRIFDQPTGTTDAVAMQHDVDYSVCGDDKKCKNEPDRKMVAALDRACTEERSPVGALVSEEHD